MKDIRTDGYYILPQELPNICSFDSMEEDFAWIENSIRVKNLTNLKRLD